MYAMADFGVDFLAHDDDRSWSRASAGTPSSSSSHVVTVHRDVHQGRTPEIRPLSFKVCRSALTVFTASVTCCHSTCFILSLMPDLRPPDNTCFHLSVWSIITSSSKGVTLCLFLYNYIFASYISNFLHSPILTKFWLFIREQLARMHTISRWLRCMRKRGVGIDVRGVINLMKSFLFCVYTDFYTLIYTD